jgi:hypothetical protein
LETRKQSLGEEHPDTARSYHNLAHTLTDQAKYGEAEPLYRRAAAIFQKFNEASPPTIASLNGLARTLAAQGKQAEAEEVGRQVLVLCQKVLGADHPYSVASSLNLASYLAGRGDYGEAEPLLTAAAKSFEVTRRRISFSGLERTHFTAEHSPLPLLAAVAAQNGKPLAAWEAVEKNLARGLLDELSAQPLKEAERSRSQFLRQTLNRLDGQISALLSVATESSRKRTEELRQQREAAQAELAQFQSELADQYGVAAGQVYDLARIQRQLPPDAALVAWVDISRTHKGANPSGEHWTCVVRHRGPPVWTKLSGSGPSATWLPVDEQLAFQARRAFGSLSEDSEGHWADFARKLYGQRLAPIERHLGVEASLPGVRHVIVLTSAQMAGIPVEVFRSAMPPRGPCSPGCMKKRPKPNHWGGGRVPSVSWRLAIPSSSRPRPPRALRRRTMGC